MSYSDPFGLCPKDAGGDGKTDTYSDCAKGTSGYNAYQASIGNGGLANDIAGAYHSCKESTLCSATAIVGGIVTGGILLRAALASPLFAGASTASIPVLQSAQGKLSNLEQQFGVASSKLVDMAMDAAKYIDNANGGNINALIARPDGASGFIRVTFDPDMQRVISAGLMRANQVTNAIANGRFTPY